MSEAATNKKTPIYKVLYFQVICAIVIGIVLGAVWPEVGEKMKPFGDGFIRLIKMIIAPVIFCTVVTGIAGMENMKKVGKTGGLALLYFEVVSTIALIIGLVIVNVVEPGSGMHVDPATLDQSAVSAYTGPLASTASHLCCRLQSSWAPFTPRVCSSFSLCSAPSAAFTVSPSCATSPTSRRSS